MRAAGLQQRFAASGQGEAAFQRLHLHGHRHS
jgi:hypothetical protein